MGTKVSLMAATCFLASATNASSEVITYRCNFPHYADPSGLYSQTDFGFSIQYDDIGGTAVIVGNLGMSPTTPIVSSNGATFVEVTSIGAVMTTTIAPDGQAVHSRNSLVVGKLVPSQHYGACPSSD